VSGEGAAAHESEMCIRVSARYKHAQQSPNCVTLEGTLCPGPILKPAPRRDSILGLGLSQL